MQKEDSECASAQAAIIQVEEQVTGDESHLLSAMEETLAGLFKQQYQLPVPRPSSDNFNLTGLDKDSAIPFEQASSSAFNSRGSFRNDPFNPMHAYHSLEKNNCWENPSQTPSLALHASSSHREISQLSSLLAASPSLNSNLLAQLQPAQNSKSLQGGGISSNPLQRLKFERVGATQSSVNSNCNSNNNNNNIHQTTPSSKLNTSDIWGMTANSQTNNLSFSALTSFAEPAPSIQFIPSVLRGDQIVILQPLGRVSSSSSMKRGTTIIISPPEQQQLTSASQIGFDKLSSDSFSHQQSQSQLQLQQQQQIHQLQQQSQQYHQITRPLNEDNDSMGLRQKNDFLNPFGLSQSLQFLASLSAIDQLNGYCGNTKNDHLNSYIDLHHSQKQQQVEEMFDKTTKREDSSSQSPLKCTKSKKSSLLKQASNTKTSLKRSSTSAGLTNCQTTLIEKNLVNGFAEQDVVASKMSSVGENRRQVDRSSEVKIEVKQEEGDSEIINKFQHNLQLSPLQPASAASDSEGQRLTKNDQSKSQQPISSQQSRRTSSRQSQHKNVYKNFGKELLRFVRVQKLRLIGGKDNSAESSTLTSDEFDQLIHLLTGGLNDKDTKQTLPVQKKEQLQLFWTVVEDNNSLNGSKLRIMDDPPVLLLDEGQDEVIASDSSEMKIKKTFRKLSWQFFDTWAFQYVITSRKLDKKEIHLKCIPSFLYGIICPKSLESFKPIREIEKRQTNLSTFTNTL